MAIDEPSHYEFEQAIDQYVQEAILSGHRSLDQLLNVLPGVYPSVVHTALQRLKIQHLLTTNAAPASDVAFRGNYDGTKHAIQLPPPHPLDYDWRFSDVAVTYLLRMCRTLASPDSTIALLGTPSVMRTALEEPLPFQFTLFEANSTMVSALSPEAFPGQVVLCDVTQDPLLHLAAQVIIADPPWYEEYVQGFLWAARQFCVTNGFVLISVPPIGTRPGMAEEWDRTLRWAMQLGLVLEGLELGALSYQTPPFEHNALRAAGFMTIPPEWRHGNLAIFKCVHPCTAARPTLLPLEGTWDDIIIRGVRIRLRQCQMQGFANPVLRPIVDGDVLPTVSRRDPRRSNVDVWTGGNRVFACHGPHVLKHIAQSLALNHSPHPIVGEFLGRTLSKAEATLVDQAIEQLDNVIACELEDLEVY